MSVPSRRALATAALLLAVPVAVRLLLVLVVDDFDADGYSRAFIADNLAIALRAHRATWNHLYVDVWPPAWSVFCAAADLLGADPYLGPKVLSALFGGLTATLSFPLARRLGADRPTAWLAWGLATVSPLHALYSATAMSEAFYGFWFLLALYCFVRAERGTLWLLGAALALLPAALTRFDVWILLPAFPLLALWQRRVSFAGAAAVTPVFAAGPLAWFALNWAARGDLFAFARVHGDYVRNFFAFHRFYADRGFVGLGIHLVAIGSAVGFTLTILGVVALWNHRDRREVRALAAILGVAFAYLFVLWIVRKQVGWRRHYLAIGSGLTVMAALGWREIRALRWRRAVAVAALFELCALTAVDVWMARWPRRIRQTADWVAARPGAIYSDEPGVRMLSGLPRDRFVDYVGLPAARDDALAHLRAKGVRWVVFADVDYSPLGALFPELRAGRDAPPFRFAYRSVEIRPLPRLLVYELIGGS